MKKSKCFSDPHSGRELETIMLYLDSLLGGFANKKDVTAVATAWNWIRSLMPTTTRKEKEV